MFEFAQSQHEKHPPSRRMVASWFISGLAHLALLIIMIENPSLMRAGSDKWIRLLLKPDTSAPESEGRLVTVLRSSPLQGPSAATLKKYMKNWDEDKSAATAPPIPIRWGNEQEEMAAKAASNLPPTVRPVPGLQEPKPSPPPTRAEDSGSPLGPAGADTPPANLALATADNAAGASKGATVYLPAPTPGEPKSIPKKITAPAAVTPPATLPDPRAATTSPGQEAKASDPPAAKVFKDQQEAIRTEGSGLFGAKGFPLGDYATMIIDRVKGNWSIPSNLRKSQGRTTVIFFISKDGRYTDLSIVTSSGSSSLDLAALSAVIGSNPFPPLPRGFPGDHVGAKFVFSYNERQ